jgi:hypothetical protein
MARPKTDEPKKTDLSATGIVSLADKMQVKFFHTHEREPFASMYVKNHWENRPLKGSEFGDWLSALCFHKLGVVPSQKALSEARNTLSGRALYENSEEKIYVRLADYGGAIYLDLGTPSWEVVRITNEGWEIVSHTPVKFVRAPGTLSLPCPIDGGTIDDFRPFLNVIDEDHWKMAVGWLIGGFRPTGPYPLLVLGGNHGSAKSTASRLLRSLIDPNAAPLRAAPTNPRDLAISAGNSWCLGFDNISSVKPWLSDALCRVSTGSGFATRALYTDGGEKIFEGMRPVLLNGIDIDIERADLLDRGIFLSLLPISDEDRETEAAVWARFEDRRPYILGSLLDAVSCALRRLPQIKLPKLPRMADFAMWVCAAEPALGWQEGLFLEAYGRNRAEANALALEASTLVQPIMRIADRGEWQSTATALQSELVNDQLNNQLLGEQKPVPQTARELSQALRRLAPNLLQIGITVEFGRTNGDNSERIITIKKVPQRCDVGPGA